MNYLQRVRKILNQFLLVVVELHLLLLQVEPLLLLLLLPLLSQRKRKLMH